MKHLKRGSKKPKKVTAVKKPRRRRVSKATKLRRERKRLTKEADELRNLKPIEKDDVIIKNAPSPIDQATWDVLETLSTFNRFDQNKIISQVLEANLAERKLEQKRLRTDHQVAFGSYEELTSIIKNQQL